MRLKLALLLMALALAGCAVIPNTYQMGFN